jgi:CO dehydrogenase/acetyl-CoA synthase epsilon subunit
MSYANHDTHFFDSSTYTDSTFRQDLNSYTQKLPISPGGSPNDHTGSRQSSNDYAAEKYTFRRKGNNGIIMSYDRNEDDTLNKRYSIILNTTSFKDNSSQDTWYRHYFFPYSEWRSYENNYYRDGHRHQYSGEVHEAVFDTYGVSGNRVYPNPLFIYLSTTGGVNISADSNVLYPTTAAISTDVLINGLTVKGFQPFTMSRFEEEYADNNAVGFSEGMYSHLSQNDFAEAMDYLGIGTSLLYLFEKKAYGLLEYHKKFHPNEPDALVHVHIPADYINEAISQELEYLDVEIQTLSNNSFGENTATEDEFISTFNLSGLFTGDLVKYPGIVDYIHFGFNYFDSEVTSDKRLSLPRIRENYNRLKDTEGWDMPPLQTFLDCYTNGGVKHFTSEEGLDDNGRSVILNHNAIYKQLDIGKYNAMPTKYRNMLPFVMMNIEIDTSEPCPWDGFIVSIIMIVAIVFTSGAASAASGWTAALLYTSAALQVALFAGIGSESDQEKMRTALKIISVILIIIAIANLASEASSVGTEASTYASTTELYTDIAMQGIQGASLVGSIIVEGDMEDVKDEQEETSNNIEELYAEISEFDKKIDRRIDYVYENLEEDEVDKKLRRIYD